MKIISLISGILILALTIFQSKESKISEEIILSEDIVLTSPIKESNLKTFNGCGIGNFLILTNGYPSQNNKPLLGALSSFNPFEYFVLDTIPGNKVCGVAFKRVSWPETTSIINSYSPYIVISDIGLFSYSIASDFNPGSNEVTIIDSISIPGILKAATQRTLDQNDPIALFVNDSLNPSSIKLYSYPDLVQVADLPFQIKPDVFEIANDTLFITAQDTNNICKLYLFDTNQGNDLGVFNLPEIISNTQELISNGDSVYILSSPGDSLTIVSMINLSTGDVNHSIINGETGSRATYNEFKNHKLFSFQLTNDTSIANLDSQIIIFDPLLNEMDTLFLNQQFDYFKHPKEASASFGFFNLRWIGAKWLENGPDTVYIDQGFETIKLSSGEMPNFINATYGCWVGVKENELSKIQFEFFPNPVNSSVITIYLSGLKKGKKYTLKIIDQIGRINFTTQVEPYQNLQLPLQNLQKGAYFLSLEIDKNVITKRLIIQ